MPDGGTQLKTTGESWAVTITNIVEKDGNYRVMYEVKNPKQEKAVLKTSAPSSTHSDAKKDAKDLSYLKGKIAKLTTTFTADLNTPALSAVELRTKYLGKKGEFNTLAQVLREIEPTAKKEAGQLLNACKTELEEKLAAREQQTATTTKWVDLTMPGAKPKVGHMHPVSQAMEEITQIFEQIGFTRVRYPEVDWDHYVFESLNMPPDHPARDEWETFFVDAPISKTMGKMVLTTHTSNGQVREMERLGSQPPIRMINIARCYRRQQDATHTQMFHQFEGLVVDKGINIQHLKGTLDYFAQQFYGPGTKSRIRPFHFRFTEPSFEVDFSCHICHGTGKVNGNKCKFCKSGWHEVGGAGMVHPNVLKAGGIDSEKYTGFAFGWGIERTYTLKQGLNIDDIRLLYSGDARFLAQF
jgi:phenylalanyl-tRNA synthetase alpha chain